MILVVGDAILDQYIPVTADGISPEWPMPRYQEVRNKTHYAPGGAANVATNVTSLGGTAALLSVVGTKPADNRLVRLVEDAHDTGARCFVSPRAGYSLPVKVRFEAGGRQVFRVDSEQVVHHGGPLTSLVGKTIRELQPDMVVVSDYAKGFFDCETARVVMDTCESLDIPVVADVKPQHAYWFRGAVAMTPNRAEFDRLCEIYEIDEQDFDRRAMPLLDKLRIGHLIVTRGDEGAAWVRRHEDGYAVTHAAVKKHSVWDLTGAGDTFIAALALRMTQTGDVMESLLWANRAAGLAVTKAGTAKVTAQEMKEPRRSAKIMTQRQLKQWVAARRQVGEKIVVTNGCFDVLHPGHLTTIEFAAERGTLVVLTNTDASIRRYKGEKRPLQSQQWRAEMLAALEEVDAVCLFGTDTPKALLRALKPDVLVKGGTTSEVVGREIVEGYGGEVLTAPAVGDWSTTEFERELAG